MFFSEIECWWTSYKKYIEEETNLTSWRNISNEKDFSLTLSNFLFSSTGTQYKNSFKFSDHLNCNTPAPTIIASKFLLTYLPLVSSREHIPALTAVKTAIREAKSPYIFSHHFIYSSWETDTIIGGELRRNILLSLTCVAVITFLLLCDLTICMTVLVMVAMTLTNVVGFLFFWGSTIDIISCICIVLSIGLCVDYSVHIAHSYLVAKGKFSGQVEFTPLHP